MPADEQPVSVDTVGRAGDQRAIIRIRIDLQILQFLRQDDSDLVYLISKRTVKDLQQKFVTRLELVNIREKLGGRKPAVTGYRTVASLAAYWEGSTYDVPDRDLQDRFICSVIHRK